MDLIHENTSFFTLFLLISKHPLRQNILSS
jgi:hypothetical protein